MPDRTVRQEGQNCPVPRCLHAANPRRPRLAPALCICGDLSQNLGISGTAVVPSAYSGHRGAASEDLGVRRKPEICPSLMQECPSGARTRLAALPAVLAGWRLSSARAPRGDGRATVWVWPLVRENMARFLHLNSGNTLKHRR